MKKFTRILILLCIPLVFSLFFFGTKSGTWSYNGGSGPQIVVTYTGSNFTIAPNSYNQPLRVDWFTPGGKQSVAVYGSTFSPLGNYDFWISGSNGSGSSLSTYRYYP